MGICSAKGQNQQQKKDVEVVAKCSPQIENTQDVQRVVKSDYNIKVKKLDGATPSRSIGQTKFAASPATRQIKQIVWADNIVESSQYRGTLKTWITLKNAQFSKCYSILTKDQCQKLNIKSKESLALVQHNLSGKMRVAEIIRKSSSSEEIVQGIIKSQLIHPNLIRIFEIYQDQHNYQIIHDFCTGGSLNHMFNNAVCTQKQAALLLKQIVEALQYVHQYELTHGGLTLSSFQKCNQSNSNYIKLVEYYPLFSKDTIQGKDKHYYMSPESLSMPDVYSKERDIWSVGIILYRLLSGSFPFTGQNQEEILESIKNYAISGNFKTQQLPPQCIGLIRSFLQIDPKKRIKLNEALNDKWLKFNIEQSQEEMDQIMKQLDSSHKISFLQCCLLSYMITTFNSEHEQSLYSIFRQFDLNHDGKINRQELTQIYISQFTSIQEVKEHVDLVFKTMDIDKNGEIDFQEFKIGAIDKNTLITEENVKEAFRILSDVEGHITLSKLTSLYPNKKKQLKQQFSAYENNQMDLKQFQQLMFDCI